MMPKLVFVGDGPARIELQTICAKEDFDAVFMGHRSGRDLAECYASADIFAFPSFTEVSRPQFLGCMLETDLVDLWASCIGSLGFGITSHRIGCRRNS